MKIRWVDAPEQQNPFAGTRATIKCIVKANPPAIVEWLDGNGDFIRKTDRSAWVQGCPAAKAI